MEDYMTIWWVWISIALLLGVVELLLPGFIFLGFAIGAVFIAGIVAVVSFGNVPALFALFAALSLVSWIALKVLFRKQSSGARIVTHDINEN